MGKEKRRVRLWAHSALIVATLLISRSDPTRFNLGSKRHFFGRDMIPRAIPPWWGGGDLELRELVQAKGGGDHHFAEWFARGMIRMAQETGDPA